MLNGEKALNGLRLLDGEILQEGHCDEVGYQGEWEKTAEKVQIRTPLELTIRREKGRVAMKRIEPVTL